eukprot:scaffold3424_cov182-Amphora_coffeaeformis.AAC.1
MDNATKEENANNKIPTSIATSRGDFLLSDLQPGEIQPITWRDTGQPVSRNAFRMGLPAHVRESLLEYCHCMGISQLLQDKLRENHSNASVDRPEVEYLRLQGKEWMIQCSPSTTKKWNSNMHWMSPHDDTANQAFLRALSAAGLDDMLACIGHHFAWEGMVAYHPSIIAVSRCDRGTFHVDATRTGAKVMNIIIPLWLVEEDKGSDDVNEHHPAELCLQDDTVRDALTGQYRTGQLAYQYHVAALLGDDVQHATSAVAYNTSSNSSSSSSSNSRDDQIRMAATFYVADITETNIAAAMDRFVTYPDHYPPPSQPQVLLRAAGAHWQRDDPSKKLPRPKR